LPFPGFLCIGAQKAGTTWLHENLQRQPGIWVPPVKELHFLDHAAPSFVKRLLSRSSHHATPREHFTRTFQTFLAGQQTFHAVQRAWHIAYAHRSNRWYEKIFEGHEEPICGEICPGYASLGPEIISEVVRKNPDLRIVYLLRDPIDRAWSSMAMHYRKFPRTIGVREQSEIMTRLQSKKSARHCAYDRNLGTWLRYVKPQNIYIGWFDRIASDPETLLKEILAFLGAPTQITSELVQQPINAGKGEAIDPWFEREIAALVKDDTSALHSRLKSTYTERWLDRIKALLSL
jgi:sulfotransferase family protein